LNNSIIDPVTFKQENFELSKSSKKAIPILNDNSLNKIFHEKRNVPNDDIIFIFRIYFQLINHKICKRILDKNEFWIFVCNYFIGKGSGKTGILNYILISNL
jgi:hypothetical protein